MATSDFWSEADLTALDSGGLVNESVMQKIWDISRIPLPFMDAVGSGEPPKASYFEWTTDSQADPDVANASIDGADVADSDNKAAGGARVGNHCQISTKLVIVTERAQAVDTIGRANELAYQIGMRQRDLRRDLEAIALYPQASVADNGNNTAGKVGTFPAWLESNTDNGTNGADGGFDSGDKEVDAPTAGEARALQTDYIHTLFESIYLNNGNPTILMTVPQIIRRLSEYALANPADFGIATPTANVTGTGSGTDQTAQGWINIWKTDFGTTVALVPNRLQQTYTSGDSPTGSDVADLFLIDPSMVEYCYLIPEHTDPLGKSGTADKRLISTQWSLRVMDEKAHGVIRDLTPTGTVTDDGS